MFKLTTLYLSVILVVLLVSWLAQRYTARRRFRNLPRVGIDPGLLGLRSAAAKAQFFDYGQQLLEKGYVQYKDTPYIIQTVDNERLVIPDKYIEELKNLPDTHISFKEELLDRFIGKYTRMDAVRGSDVHCKVVRYPLTKSLGTLLPKIKEEAELGLDKVLKECNSKDYTPIKASDLIFSAIGQVTSRIIVDEPFSRDTAWLETIVGYTASVAIFSMTMRRINPLLRPLAYWTLQSGKKLRADIAKVKSFLLPVLQARQGQHYTSPNHGDHDSISKRSPKQQTIVENVDDNDNDNDNNNGAPQDLLQWLSNASDGPGAHPSRVVLKILFLVVAAMHTSAITTIHILYDLCAYPSSMAELRAEAASEIASGGWTLATLLKLRKMESFLKESGRINSAGVVSFQRFVLRPIRLSNGFEIPAGTHICAASDARSRDPEMYPEPKEFRPLRFYCEAAGDLDAANLFSSVAAGDSWFGVGRQACPGRWYASALIKLVLCLLLLEYDITYPEGELRPKNWVKDEKTGPDMEQMILFKKRAK